MPRVGCRITCERGPSVFTEHPGLTVLVVAIGLCGIGFDAEGRNLEPVLAAADRGPLAVHDGRRRGGIGRAREEDHAVGFRRLAAVGDIFVIDAVGVMSPFMRQGEPCAFGGVHQRRRAFPVGAEIDPGARHAKAARIGPRPGGRSGRIAVGAVFLPLHVGVVGLIAIAEDRDLADLVFAVGHLEDGVGEFFDFLLEFVLVVVIRGRCRFFRILVVALRVFLERDAEIEDRGGAGGPWQRSAAQFPGTVGRARAILDGCHRRQPT